MKARALGDPEQGARVEPAIDVLNATAAAADGVLMGIETGVIEGGVARWDPAREAQLDEVAHTTAQRVGFISAVA